MGRGVDYPSPDDVRRTVEDVIYGELSSGVFLDAFSSHIVGGGTVDILEWFRRGWHDASDKTISGDGDPACWGTDVFGHQGIVGDYAYWAGWNAYRDAVLEDGQ